MLSQTYLIYLGIAVVIIIIAFFAYQELQKHKMEIQKLRFQSEKLQKIIHAYNMQQWAQQTEYPEESETDDEDEDDENEDEEERDEDEEVELDEDDARQVVNDILKEALSASGGGANTVVKSSNQVESRDGDAQKQSAPVNRGGPTMVMAARTTRIARAMPMQVDPRMAMKGTGEVQLGPSIFMSAKPVTAHAHTEALPDVETFEVEDEDVVPEEPKDMPELLPRSPHPQMQQSLREQSRPIIVEQEESNETETNESEDDEDEEDNEEQTTINVSENENENNKDEDSEDGEAKSEASTTCPMILKSGSNKGNPCGKKAKLNGFCLTHFRKQNA